MSEVKNEQQDFTMHLIKRIYYLSATLPLTVDRLFSGWIGYTTQTIYYDHTVHVIIMTARTTKKITRR
jgi:hypothetical protein